MHSLDRIPHAHQVQLFQDRILEKILFKGMGRRM